MKTPQLIYCGGGNQRFSQIAIEAGFLYGAQVPDTVYYKPYFCDQNWKQPNLSRYLAALAKHKPNIATVLDWEYPNQLPTVLAWAEAVAAYVETVIIIPKVVGGVARLPRQVGHKSIRLGYSVPTRYGGTTVPFTEFYGWSVHLLGGSPHQQRRLAMFLNVVSVDGNMMQKMATKYCAFYDPAKRTRRGYWPTLKDYDGEKWADGTSNADAPYEAFERSCRNIMAMWNNKGVLPLFKYSDRRKQKW